MKTKIKNCPFCGDSAESQKINGMWEVFCTNILCCASMGNFTTQKSAISQWNKRNLIDLNKMNNQLL